MVDRGRRLDDNSFMPLFGEVPKIDIRREEAVDLPPWFVPDKWSVICGRGREIADHVGNKRLQILVDCHADSYEKASTKMERSTIVSSIVEAVRNGSASGGFVKKNTKTGLWYEVGDQLAREKVGIALRKKIRRRNSSRRAYKDSRHKSLMTMTFPTKVFSGIPAMGSSPF